MLERTERELVITRVFHAPRAVVWKAWTDPAQVKRWWGPRGYTSPFCQSDFRVGGRYLYCMRSPEGKEYWNTGVYLEIIPLARIVFTDSFSDPQGNVVPASQYGLSPDFPLEILSTVAFEDLGESTKFTLRQAGLPASTDTESARKGWIEAFDKLAGVLG